MPDVTVVIATHNRAARLSRLLEALRHQTLPADRFEVVVVDDASRDHTQAVLEGESRGLRLRSARNEAPLGPGGARNTGWRLASSPLVAFTDDDCRPTPRWLEAGLSAWAGDEGCFVQGPIEPDPADAPRMGPFSRTLTVDRLGPFFPTANVFYPRSLLDRHGGFDTQAFPGYGAEDADLAWRCLREGAQARWAPTARVFHAVHELGPIGKLGSAWRWSEAVNLYARHRQRRDQLVYGLFWKRSHFHVLRILAGLLLPERLRSLRFWFFAPLATSYVFRARSEGGSPFLAPYFVLHDAVETAAILRGALRYRVLVI